MLEELARGAADRPPPPARGASPAGLPILFEATVSRRQCERVICQAFRPTAATGQPQHARPRSQRGEEEAAAGAPSGAGAGVGILQAALLQLISDRFAQGYVASAADTNSAAAIVPFRMEAYDFLKVPDQPPLTSARDRLAASVLCTEKSLSPRAGL